MLLASTSELRYLGSAGYGRSRVKRSRLYSELCEEDHARIVPINLARANSEIDIFQATDRYRVFADTRLARLACIRGKTGREGAFATAQSVRGMWPPSGLPNRRGMRQSLEQHTQPSYGTRECSPTLDSRSLIPRSWVCADIAHTMLRPPRAGLHVDFPQRLDQRLCVSEC